MSDPAHRFFLQAIDLDYSCPVLEAMFSVANLDDLRATLGPCAADDPELERWYSIESNNLARISERFGVEFEPGDRPMYLQGWDRFRTFPYLVHGGYELFLLLYGAKKLARFNDPYPPVHHDGEDLFDRHVAEGQLYKEVYIEPFASPVRPNDGQIVEGLREVYYTPKGEEWRIPASRLLWAAAAKFRWNEGFERLEGMLFGYEEWQIDWWIAHCRERGARWAESKAKTEVGGTP
jgi:hypothetical protein